MKRIELRKIVNEMKIQIGSLLLIIASFFIQRDEKKWAFGSWLGNAYSDNSKYLLESALKTINDSEYTFYWVGNTKIRNDLPNDSRVVFLQLNTIRSLLRLMKCRFFFCSQFPGADICQYNVFRGATIVYLHHGIPIKKIGTDVRNNKIVTNGLKYYLGKISGANRRFDYIIASSSLNAEASSSGYGYLGVKMDNNLCVGYPRNDYLIKSKDSVSEITKVKSLFAGMLHYPVGKKIITYLPTFRWDIDKTPSIFFLNETEKCKIQKILNDNNAILIEKSHNRLIRRGIKASNGIIEDGSMLFLSSMVDTQELLLCTDCLITDYSGCMLDYLILDRPIINYVPDYEYYRDHDAGLLYDLSDFSCGDIPMDIDGLIISLEKYFQGVDVYREKRCRNRKRFLEFECGDSGEKICNVCTGKEPFTKYCYLSNIN